MKTEAQLLDGTTAYYETTPYAVQKTATGWDVVQSWWGKVISSHDSEESARAACIDAAWMAGSLKRYRR